MIKLIHGDTVPVTLWQPPHPHPPQNFHSSGLSLSLGMSRNFPLRMRLLGASLHEKDNESCKFSILIAIVDPPGNYCLDHYLFCRVFVAKVKNWFEGKICSNHGLRLGLRKANGYHTGQDGSFCIGDLFNEWRRTEFEIGDEWQTENIPAGCDKLSTDQRCIQRREEGNIFGYVADCIYQIYLLKCMFPKIRGL